MIHYSKKYSINNDQGFIVFEENKQGTIIGTYEISNQPIPGLVNGTMEDGVLKGTYHNKSNNSVGLIEFSFSANSFSAKWKQGIDPGPMRGKWTGSLIEDGNIGENKTESTNAIQYFLNCSSRVEDFEINPKSVRLFVIYIENQISDNKKEILLNSIGYEGGSIQGSKSYKVIYNGDSYEVLGDEFNPDYWDKKWVNNSQKNVEEDVSTDEKNSFRKLNNEMRNFILPEYEVDGADEDGEGFLINPDKLSELNFVDEKATMHSDSFNLTYLKIMAGKWPFITDF
jgi:hypothetical protein